ncbi:MAG: hypothetical protein J6J18_01735 [Oscillospiraceae bacterium]|nr:hypothetical protein [Oscillospiraceae bacterium]
MKKYTILALILVLTAFSLTGCRNPGKNMEPTTVPTTHATTAPTIMPTTEATHQPTEHTENNTNATEHTAGTTVPGEVIPDTTDTTNATGEARARQMPRNR